MWSISGNYETYTVRAIGGEPYTYQYEDSKTVTGASNIKFIFDLTTEPPPTEEPTDIPVDDDQPSPPPSDSNLSALLLPAVAIAGVVGFYWWTRKK